MMRFLAALLLSLSAVACSSIPEPVKVNPVATMRAATVQLGTMEEDKFKGFCSAVRISETILLSAAHCDIGVPLSVEGKKASVIGKDEKNDLLLLYSRGECPCVPYVHPAKQDDEVWAVGFPLDAGEVVTKGIAQSVNDKGEFLYTAPVTWGNSGGPVFVVYGDEVLLVSITSRGTIITFGGFIPVVIQHLNYGAGYKAIAEFLREHR